VHVNIFTFIHYAGIVNIFIFDIIHVVIIIIIGGLMEMAGWLNRCRSVPLVSLPRRRCRACINSLSDAIVMLL
jgi:hypothetical protein